MAQRANDQLLKEETKEEDEEEEDFFSMENTREYNIQTEEKKKNYTFADWQNAVLVLVSARLGLKKVQEEYHQSVYYFFTQNFNAGIIGGRPKEAFYFVGLQDKWLIFLDPHVTREAFGPDLKDIKRNHL